MWGVIFGEWRGEDPADKDMPRIGDKKTYFFQNGHDAITSCKHINCLKGAQLFQQ